MRIASTGRFPGEPSGSPEQHLHLPTVNSLVRIGAVLASLGACQLALSAAPSRRSLQNHEIVIDKELLITAVEVVDSPQATYPGPWSFGHLMNEAFGAKGAPVAVALWLEAWAAGKPTQRAGEIGLPQRELLHEKLIRPWQEADGFNPDGEESWEPNFENAPFQLLAIVNRMDLSDPLASFVDPAPVPAPSAGYYRTSPSQDSGAGEGRFIFAVTDQNGQPLEGGVTLILEYGLDANRSQDRLLDWAMAWHRLGEHEEFNAAYRGDLAKLTRAFTDRKSVPKQTTAQRAADAGRMNLIERLSNPFGRVRDGMTLIRVRTNDGAFGETREFREFAFESSDSGEDIKGALTPAPLAGTPREIFFRKGTRENRFLARWLRAQRGGSFDPITARDRPGAAVPTSFALPQWFRLKGQAHPVVARVAPVPGNDDSYHWDGWGVNDNAMRMAFSMQTCCGCHCGDTNTAFFHVSPRSPGQAAPLSQFLRTDDSRWRLKDPSSGRTVASAEMQERLRLFETVLRPDLSISQIKAIRERRNGRGH